MALRIIGGIARGRTLQAPPGRMTRPTADRVREAMFSIIESALGPLIGLEVLDLYAGSGALGLEALSRGAASAVLVDHHPRCQRTIRANAEALGLSSRCRLLPMDVSAALRLLAREGQRFALVLADPPYAEDPRPLLAMLAQQELVAPAGLFVLEHDNRQPELGDYGALVLRSRRRYGDSALSIYQHSVPSTQTAP